MPREIVHWSVLEEAMGPSAPAGLRSLLNEHREAAYLGAVAHDAPYYHRFGRGAFSVSAEALHGTHGEDTFLPFRSLVEAIAREQDTKPLRAFFLGMLSHYATDVIFHPVVYYFTGNYHDADPAKRRLAQTRHRLFEVYLDSYFQKRRLSYAVGYHLIADVISADPEVSLRLFNILHCLPEPYGSAGKSSDKWESSFRSMAHLQRLFLSEGAGAIARGIKFLSGNLLVSEEALFSFGRKEHPLFEKSLSFKNPVSGAAETKTVSELYQEALREFLLLATQLESFLVEGKAENALRFLSGAYGKSLNFGVPKTDPTVARFFTDESPFSV